MSTSSSAMLRSGTLSPPLASPSKTPSKRRANDLLRNYYGLGDASATSSPSSGQRLDLDSYSFDAQAAFQSLMQEKSLSQLLKSESDLLTEIRELDGERQSLVYNHHHELVAASETIGKMKERADALTPSLTSLRTSLRDISQSLQDVQTTLDTSKEDQKKDEAGGRNLEHSPTDSEIQKIIAPAVELPGRLRDIILLEENGVGLEKARGLWGSMEAVLATWDEAGIPGAKDIMNECRHVLREAQHRK